MLAVRTPIAGIFVAVLVLVAEVVAMKAYVAAQRPTQAVVRTDSADTAPRPTFGRHRGCADRLKISGPDDFGPQPSR